MTTTIETKTTKKKQDNNKKNSSKTLDLQKDDNNNAANYDILMIYKNFTIIKKSTPRFISNQKNCLMSNQSIKEYTTFFV